MNKKVLWWLPVLLGLGVVGLGTYGRADDGHTAARGKGAYGNAMGSPALPVQAAPVRLGDLNVTLSALGTVTARNTAVVKARVSGQLQSISFREGDTVKQGDLLAEIDPRPFQAQLDQAVGQLAHDEAQLAGARADLERYRGLLKQDSIASQEVDNQAWLVRQYEGTVKNDQGKVADARLQLEFTRITAPFAGRVGLRQVDVGNVVQPNDENGIVVITQTQPIYVVFAIPADQLHTVNTQWRTNKTLTVDIFDRLGTTQLASGHVSSIDNQIDIATNTVKVKAEFPNTDEKLFPNQFVNVRLKIATEHNAILAPSAAIQRGSDGTFVYVIGSNNTVQMKKVVLGETQDDVVAVRQGLSVGGNLVIDGADKLRDGASVIVATPGAGAKSSAGTPSTVGSKDNHQKSSADKAL